MSNFFWIIYTKNSEIYSFLTELFKKIGLEMVTFLLDHHNAQAYIVSNEGQTDSCGKFFSNALY